MAKKKSYKGLKEELSKLFQLYVRIRDVDDSGYGDCISCGKRVHYKEADAGHYQSRSILSTLWMEENCNLQCKKCNGWGDNTVGAEYAKNLDEKYGHGTALKIKNLRNESIKVNSLYLESEIIFYKNEVKRLKEIKSL